MSETFDVTNPAKPTIEKDPDAVLDYEFDWGAWLAEAGEVAISSSGTFVEVTSDGSQGVSDVSVLPAEIVGTSVIAWVSGGLPGEKVALRCHIKTPGTPPAGGREDDRTVYLKIKER